MLKGARDAERVRQAEKGYRGIKIWVEDYDEYAYFKRTLIQTFKTD